MSDQRWSKDPQAALPLRLSIEGLPEPTSYHGGSLWAIHFERAAQALELWLAYAVEARSAGWTLLLLDEEEDPEDFVLPIVTSVGVPDRNPRFAVQERRHVDLGGQLASPRYPPVWQSLGAWLLLFPHSVFDTLTAIGPWPGGFFEIVEHFDALPCYVGYRVSEFAPLKIIEQGQLAELETYFSSMGCLVNVITSDWWSFERAY